MLSDCTFHCTEHTVTSPLCRSRDVLIKIIRSDSVTKACSLQSRRVSENNSERLKHFGSFVQIYYCFSMGFFSICVSEALSHLFFYCPKCIILFMSFYLPSCITGKCLKSSDISNMLCLGYKRQKCHHVLFHPFHLLHVS